MALINPWLLEKKQVERRSMVERKIDALKAIRDGNTRIYRLMMVANIAHIDAKQMLVVFAKKDFVRLAPNGKGYDRCYLQLCITDKGLNMIYQWDQFKSALSDPPILRQASEHPQ